MRKPRRATKSWKTGYTKPDPIKKWPKDITERYCIVCETMTPFEYNKAIGHSECRECGARFATKEPPKKTHLNNQDNNNPNTQKT